MLASVASVSNKLAVSARSGAAESKVVEWTHWVCAGTPVDTTLTERRNGYRGNTRRDAPYRDIPAQ